MFTFLGRIIQLLLSAEHGWEDISAAAERAEDIQRKRLLPLLCVVAASQLVRLFYEPQLGVFSALAAVVAVAGAYVASLFIGKMLMGVLVSRCVDDGVNMEKVHVVTMYMLGLTAVYRLVYNMIPTQMMLMKLLPLLSLLVMMQSAAYLGVSSDRRLRLMAIGFLIAVIIPSVITYLFMMFI